MLKYQCEKGSSWGGRTQKCAKNRTTPTPLQLEAHSRVSWGNLSFSRPLDQQSALCTKSKLCTAKWRLPSLLTDVEYLILCSCYIGNVSSSCPGLVSVFTEQLMQNNQSEVDYNPDSVLLLWRA